MVRLRRISLTVLVAGTLFAASGCLIEGRGSGSCCSGCGSAPQSYGVPASEGSSSAQAYVYKCPMDGGTRDTPGPCPICGMTLEERDRVVR